MFERKDHFYERAKREGHASRAVYKLSEIQKKYKILKTGNRVLELGAAPGGWLPLIAKEIGLKGNIVAIDLLPLKIPPPKNAQFFQIDLADLDETIAQEKFNVILSDISPNLSGITFQDSYRSHEIAQTIFGLCAKRLASNGNLVIKIFPGDETKTFKKELEKQFQTLKTFIPEATRKTSSEVYLIALGFKNG